MARGPGPLTTDPRTLAGPLPAARSGGGGHEVRRALAVRRAVAVGALAAMAAAAIAIAVGTAAGPSAVVPIGRVGFPHWLAGPLAGLGPPLRPAGFAALLLVMCAAYAVVLAHVRALPARVVLGGVVALHLAFLLAPPILNTDVLGYLAYARIGVVHGLNPYAHGAAAIHGDPVYPYVGVKWLASPYGPLFTLGTYALAPLGPAAGVWLLKLACAGASLGCVGLVGLVERRRGRPPVPAAAFVGLNPVLLAWDVGSAHNDVLMALLVSAGVYLAFDGREASGAAAIVGAAAVKLAGAVVLPFALLGGRRRGRALAGAVAAAGGVAAVSLAAFGPAGMVGFARAVDGQNLAVSKASVPYCLGRALGLGGAAPAVHLVAGAVLGGAVAWLAWRTWRGADWVTSAGWAVVAVLLTTDWLMPWYVVWLLPLAALGRSRALRAAALGLGAFIVVARLALLPA